MMSDYMLLHSADAYAQCTLHIGTKDKEKEKMNKQVFKRLDWFIDGVVSLQDI